MKLKIISCFILFQLFSYSLTGADQKRVLRIVNDWCEAHNKWKINKLRLLYAPELFYYGERIPAEKCISEKSVFFRPKDFYLTTIASDVKVRPVADEICKCDFIRSTMHNGEKKAGWMYLLIRFHGLDPEIVAESDSLSDRKTGFHPDSIAKLYSNIQREPLDTQEDDFWDFVPYIAALATLIIAAVVILLFRKRRQDV